VITDYAPHLHHHRIRSGRRLRRSLLLGGVAACLGIASFSQVAYGGSTTSTTQVVVHSGDTLWSIAAAHYPGDDVQSRIAEIIEANHLSGAAVHPGQRLALPGG
jgi:nucleoid-associated protein YgaU